MSFVISGLDPARFAPLFRADAGELLSHQAQWREVDSCPGFPCRVTLEDAQIGERILLVHFEHFSASSPYRASGPIFVRPGFQRRVCAPGEVPESLQRRLLSLRAYDTRGSMVAAEVVEGHRLADALHAALRDQQVANLQLHHARPGCFAAGVTRVA